ncbi:MAG: PfkB family carbohydrate kinase [Bryobacteraceae bacterium]|nr:PfkB family carbohydrate kinase [Bryobacteraceae bacterium]
MSRTAEILAKLRDLRVLVLGDICLDRWCWYDPSLAEASAETGIPRTGVVRTIVTPGAGGTVANNLAALGVRRIDVLGVIGNDGFGSELRRAMTERGIVPDLLIESPDVVTFTYTKLINSLTDEEDLPRVDFVNTQPLPVEAERQVLAAVEKHWAVFDVVIVADQAETGAGGMVTAAVRDLVSRKAAESPEKVVWVDSRRRAELYRHVVLKPNRREAEDACRRSMGVVDFHGLATETEARLLIVTHGERGALVIQNGEEHWMPTRRVRAVDICGAGDSFTAGAACAYRITGSGMEAARFGNLVASITVTKKGTGSASPEEVLAADTDMAAEA